MIKLLSTTGILLAVSLTSFATIAEAQTPYVYPQEAINNILTECRQDTEQIFPPDQAKLICECVLDKMRAQFSYSQYEKIIAKGRQEGKNPPEFTALGEECFVQLFL